MRHIIRILALNAAFFCAARSGMAQSGPAGATQTIQPGNFRVFAFPYAFLFRDHDAAGTPRTMEGIDDIVAVAFGGGLGITDWLDASLVLVGTEDVASAEARLAVGRQVGPVNLLLSGGVHADSFLTDFYDHAQSRFVLWGYQGTLVVGLPLGTFEPYAGATIAYETTAKRLPFLDRHFVRYAVTPGLSYAYSANLKLVAETAIKLNDQAFGYSGVGFLYAP